MTKRRLKPVVKVSILGLFLIVSMICIGLFTTNNNSDIAKADDNYTYVNDYIFDSYYPVVNQEEKIVRPYTSDKVSIYKNFYEKDASNEDQEKALIYHENIYMQNSGIDYKSDESFDVVASLSGTVTNVSDDSLLGKTVEIRNSTELIMTYQSLGEVTVKKGDTITQGQVIGKSGTCALNENISQGLHFEMYKNGQVINPEKYFDKSVKDLADN